MSNSFSQIIIHLIFAAKHRQCLIHHIKTDLYRYITGVVHNSNNGNKLYAIGGMPDHIHILTGIHPTQCVSQLVKDIKVASSTWINKQDIYMGKFHWQDGYGAFSIGQSMLDSTVQYILNQEIHHRQKTFREEYREFLTKYNIPYDERYIFDDLL